MVTPGERIAEEEESENTDDADSVESYHSPASTGDVDISTGDDEASPPGCTIISPDYGPSILSSDSGISSPGPSIPSHLHTRSGKAKKTKKDTEVP